MKLSMITEMHHEEDEDDDVAMVLQELEEFVDLRKGRFQPEDQRYLAKYLSKFSQHDLKQVAAQLGTAQFTPAELSAQIISGELLAPMSDVMAGGPPSPGPSATPGDVGSLHDRADIGDLFGDNTHSDDDLPSYGPSDEQLDYIERPMPSQRNGSTFRNARPTINVAEAGKINTDLNSLPPKALRFLKRLAPSDLVDEVRPGKAQPFIYIANDPIGLYVGRLHEYHHDILDHFGDNSPIKNIYRGGSYTADLRFIPNSAKPGTVGRFGYDLSMVDPSLKNVTVVAIYAKTGSEDPLVVGATVKALIDGQYIPQNAIVSFGGELSYAANTAKTGASADDEARRLGALQIALHLGAWPNGKRLTGPERKAIEQELGREPRPMQKHPIQAAQEKHGLLKPGQRWWAPTSEHKLRSI